MKLTLEKFCQLLSSGHYKIEEGHSIYLYIGKESSSKVQKALHELGFRWANGSDLQFYIPKTNRLRFYELFISGETLKVKWGSSHRNVLEKRVEGTFVTLGESYHRNFV